MVLATYHSSYNKLLCTHVLTCINTLICPLDWPLYCLKYTIIDVHALVLLGHKTIFKSLIMLYSNQYILMPFYIIKQPPFSSWIHHQNRIHSTTPHYTNQFFIITHFTIITILKVLMHMLSKTTFEMHSIVVPLITLCSYNTLSKQPTNYALMQPKT